MNPLFIKHIQTHTHTHIYIYIDRNIRITQQLTNVDENIQNDTKA